MPAMSQGGAIRALGLMALSWSALGVLDLCLAGDHPGLEETAIALGLCAGFGGALAISWIVVASAVGKLPRVAQALFWPAAWLCAGALLARDLGAFSRLDGPHGSQAAFTLLACGLGGLCMGTLFFAMQGGMRHEPIARRLRLRVRVPLAALLITVAAAFVYADRTYYPGLYAEAHVALRLVAAILLAVSAASLLPRAWPRGRLVHIVLAAAIAAVAGLPFLLLDERDELVLGRMVDLPFPATALDLLRDATDVDADGYSSLLAGGDCAWANPAVNPGADEIAGNGIDDNCQGGDGGDAIGILADETDVPVPTEPSPVNVALIVLDAVRADHTTPYGYARATTPRLRAFAKDAIVFENAFALGGWTSIAMHGAMRGVYPRRLRWTRHAETNRYRLLRLPYEPKLMKGEKFRAIYMLPVDDGHEPLAWWLRRRGMHTAAVVNDGFSRMLSRDTKADVGFARWHEVDDKEDRRRGDEAIADLAIAALDGLSRNEPFFFWTHFFCVHRPYRRPPRTAFGDEVADKYDGQLANCDAAAGRLLEALAARRFSRPLVVVVTADHGEGFHKKGAWHGDSVREELLRVPLIVRAPGVQARRVSTPVSLVDLVPTVLASTETPGPDWLDGEDLIGIAKGASRRLPLFADNWKVSPKGDLRMEMTAAFDGEIKMVLDHRRRARSLVSQAPGRWDEDRNELIGAEASRALRKVLDAYIDRTAAPGSDTE